MTRKHKSREEVYAILRSDDFHSPDTPVELRVTVKEVVRNEDVAAAEIRRLNAENADKGAHYWYQVTRFFPGRFGCWTGRGGGLTSA